MNESFCQRTHALQTAVGRTLAVCLDNETVFRDVVSRNKKLIAPEERDKHSERSGIGNISDTTNISLLIGAKKCSATRLKITLFINFVKPLRDL